MSIEKGIIQQQNLERFLLEQKEGSLLSINFPIREYCLWVKFQDKRMVGLAINHDKLKKLKLDTKEKALKELKKKKHWKPIRFNRREGIFLGNFEFN